MRVEISSPGLSLVPGKPSVLTVSVTNSGTVISGHSVRVLGLDANWVSIDHDRLSLFPDMTGEFAITFRVPHGLPAGTRTVDVEVSELTPPFEVVHHRLTLTIPAEPNVTVSIDPASITGNRGAEVGVLVENTGNSTVDVKLSGEDQEHHVAFTFSPRSPRLAPGEQLVATAKLRAKRPWFGNPKIRPYTVSAGPSDPPSMAFGAWMQRPRLTRGNLALLGLMVAATVFAVVISAALSQVVSQSNADRDLALQVAEASQNQPIAGTSSISGLVSLTSTGAPVSGITVDLYTSSNTSQPIVSTATAAPGTFSFTGLAAGNYKLSFDGAGFVELWYPESLTAKGAGVVTVGNHQNLANIDIRLGGEPASVSGQVVGANTAGAIVSLELPGPPGTNPAAGAATAPPGAAAGNTGTAPTTTAVTTTTAAGSSGTASSGTSGAGTSGSGTPGSGTSGSGTSNGGAATNGATTTASTSQNVPVIVSTQTLTAAGSFAFNKVPSPATYYLVVTEPGYATATQEIDLSGGDNRSGVTIQLHKGDGSVSGTVSSASGPIGGATISASTGQTTINTVTATTKGKVGAFSLTSLPTPTTLTVTVSAPGYAPATLTVSLAPAQQVTGIAITLLPGTGSISGTVVTPKDTPIGGVTVTASNGTLTVSTTTLSKGHPGTYTITGLPVPGTYTVTFSRSDLASQTQAVSLPATGATNAKGIDVKMVAQTASITGVVRDQQGVGQSEIAIALVSGANTYQTMSAAKPKPGSYEINGVVPGTYNLTFTRQGGVPTSVIVDLGPGQTLIENEVLTPAASIYGYVVLASTGQAVPDAQVNLYASNAYPTVISATTTTGTTGEFAFNNVAAPQSFIVAISFPAGSSPQATVLITTSLGVASPICGSNATGSSASTTTTTPGSSTSTTTAGSTGATGATGAGTVSLAHLAHDTTTSSTTTTAAASGSTGASGPPQNATCNPQTDPVEVSLS